MASPNSYSMDTNNTSYRYRTLVFPLFESVTLGAGQILNSDILIIADGGFESLHTIITGTGTLTLSYTCDNSNNDSNFAIPYVDNINVGTLVTSRSVSNKIEGISMIPSARKIFTATNSNGSSIVFSVYLDVIL